MTITTVLHSRAAPSLEYLPLTLCWVTTLVNDCHTKCVVDLNPIGTAERCALHVDPDKNWQLAHWRKHSFLWFLLQKNLCLFYTNYCDLMLYFKNIKNKTRTHLSKCKLRRLYNKKKQKLNSQYTLIWACVWKCYDLNRRH